MFCSIRIGSPIHFGLMNKAVFTWKGPQQITETYRHVHLTHIAFEWLLSLPQWQSSWMWQICLCVFICVTRLLSCTLPSSPLCVCFYICAHFMSACWLLLTPRHRKWHTRFNHVSQMTPRCHMIHADRGHLLSQWADKACWFIITYVAQRARSRLKLSAFLSELVFSTSGNIIALHHC